MTARARRVAGAALVLLLALHVALRPEQGWVLLSTCDLAAIATAVGLLVGSRRVVGAALVFELAIGIPAFVLGLFTTYPLNVTGVAIHVLPPLAGLAYAAREGLAPRSAWLAWIVVLAGYVAARAIAPTELNINFATATWPPLERVLPSPLVFAALVLGGQLVLLLAGELAVRRLVAALSSAPAPTPSRPRGTAR
jgi:hypothetical protein